MPTISYDITVPQANRAAAAIGRELKLGRDATAPEVRRFAIDLFVNFVLSREQYDAKTSAVAAVPPPSPLDVP